MVKLKWDVVSLPPLVYGTLSSLSLEAQGEPPRLFLWYDLKNPTTSSVALSGYPQGIHIWSSYQSHPTYPFPCKHQLLSIWSPKEIPRLLLFFSKGIIYLSFHHPLSQWQYIYPCIFSMISPHCSQNYSEFRSNYSTLFPTTTFLNPSMGFHCILAKDENALHKWRCPSTSH